jgi:hypothetical protein
MITINMIEQLKEFITWEQLPCMAVILLAMSSLVTGYANKLLRRSKSGLSELLLRCMKRLQCCT